jgi:plastocyanin
MKVRVSILVVALLISTTCSRSGTDESATAMAEPPRPVTASGRTLVLGQAPPGSVIALEPQFAHEFPSPGEPGYVDQSGQMFIPELLTARTGQEVQFRSSEDVLHNVRVDHATTKEPIFNVATPPWGKYVHKFAQPGFYNVTCDIHTTMRATLFLTDAPYVTQVSETGSFRFLNVVPGSYKVTGFIQGTAIDRKIDVSGNEITLQLF